MVIIAGVIVPGRLMRVMRVIPGMSIHRRRPAGEARARADERDQARKDRADKRQKNGGLLH